MMHRQLATRLELVSEVGCSLSDSPGCAGGFAIGQGITAPLLTEVALGWASFSMGIGWTCSSAQIFAARHSVNSWLSCWASASYQHHVNSNKNHCFIDMQPGWALSSFLFSSTDFFRNEVRSYATSWIIPGRAEQGWSMLIFWFITFFF